MTRAEFLHELHIADDTWDYEAFSPHAQAIAHHDAEQREEIERLNLIFRERTKEWREGVDIIDEQDKTIQALRDALQGLVDVQNGPPLWKYKAEWEAAMTKAERLLKETQP